MTTAETDLVRDLFAARVSDLTPLAARQSARVLYVPVARDPETSSRCASILSDNERQRAARLKPEDEKDRFVQRRAFRRFCGATALGSSRPLSETVFEETEKGRPYLLDSPSLWFSFSSSRRGFLGAWSFTHAIGIDLEDPARELNATDLARQYFSAAEAEVVGAAVGPERLRTFYRFWTLKEAALKSIGEGLPFGLDTFRFRLDPKPRVILAPLDHGGHARFDSFTIVGTGGCAALVIRYPETQEALPTV